MKQPFLYTEGLDVGYPGTPILSEIMLDIRRGEIVSLIGPNGGGKTTLLKSLIAQLPPIKGVIYLKGKELREIAGADLARQVSVVLTERIRPELMTCEDVVAAGRYPYTGRFGVLSDHDRTVIRRSMELVQVWDLASRYYSQCSDGQKQRIMLARALCQEPSLLVLDEPTSYLDLRYKLELLTVLQKLSREESLSVLMSLHEVDLAGKVSDRIAAIRNGRIERFGAPEEVLRPGYVRELYEIDAGTYDDRSGSLELEAARGDPRVFILAGNGSGTELFRLLQRKGVPFATGILWENDLDVPVARALASEVVTAKPFSEVEEAQRLRTIELIDRCECLVCTLEEEQMTGLAAALRDLLEYGETQGKRRNPAEIPGLFREVSP